jgi:hypothetical protein
MPSRFGGIRVGAVAAVGALLVVAWSTGTARVDKSNQELASGNFAAALATCQVFLVVDPIDCDANYANLIASTMLVVGSINTYVLPAERSGPPPAVINALEGALFAAQLEGALQAAETVTALGYEYDLASMPLLIGDASDPIVNGEVRGTWTTRTASLLGAIHAALLYDFQTLADPQAVSPGGQSNPSPPLLASMKSFLEASQALLFTQPTTPDQLRGGWVRPQRRSRPRLG